MKNKSLQCVEQDILWYLVSWTLNIHLLAVTNVFIIVKCVLHCNNIVGMAWIYCSTQREYISNISLPCPLYYHCTKWKINLHQILLLSSVYIIQCTHLTVLNVFITVKWVHWPMYTLDSTKNCQKVYIEIPANKISENILFNAL